MYNLNSNISNFLCDETGLTTVEYAIAGALVTVGLVLAFTSLGAAVATQVINISGLV